MYYLVHYFLCYNRNRGVIMNIRKEYFKILSPEFPTWLNEYINTDRLQKQKDVSVTCGKVYSKLFDLNDFSSLDHSIAVALIIWNFTKNKKQTLAGLFHDISTPSFKHCIDFMNNDHLKQESTEDLTYTFIKESKDIMNLLKKDNIKIDEVSDYKKYPIADNDIPMLSADRLEYTLSNSLIVFKISNLDDIRMIYNDIEIQKNEKGIIELGFKTKKIARLFVKLSSELSIKYRDDETRFFMQAIADILKMASKDNIVSKDDLYKYGDLNVIDIIKKSKYKDDLETLLSIKKVLTSHNKPIDKYSVNQKVKVRYIDPLYNNKRMSKECTIARKMIEKNLNYNMNKYIYINENLKYLD